MYTLKFALKCLNIIKQLSGENNLCSVCLNTLNIQRARANWIKYVEMHILRGLKFYVFERFLVNCILLRYSNKYLS